MRTRIIVATLLISIAVLAQEKLQRLNVKTGLWEVTTTINRQGHTPIPAALLDRLTPEQRARMEARLKAQPDQHTSTITHQDCVTEEDLQKMSAFSKNPNFECTQKVLSSTSTVAEVHMDCQGEGIKANGTMRLQALSSENVKGSVKMTAIGNGQTMNTDSEFTSRWVSATCPKK